MDRSASAWRVETGMPAAEYLEQLVEKQLELRNGPATAERVRRPRYDGCPFASHNHEWPDTHDYFSAN
ncbi:hypothetical protein FHX81_0397 [Saccharothrix saharensis]|uniref:Uncharacterized protein n=2 Tax=Saccharothrix saharensis TaxID=571190 RepID=A0A543J5R7_9PSEU|nr:hypothetical protein FHX81_0397 [Saccharothrix saharensis]